MSIPIHCEQDKLANLLRDHRFAMLYNQRPYSWDDKQVQALLDDVLSAIKKGKGYRYLGVVTLISHDDNEYEVIDGQQRITTFMLICARLCKLLNEQGDSASVKNIIRVLFDVDEFHNKTYEDVTKMDGENLSLRLEPLMDEDKFKFRLFMAGNDGQNGKMASAWETIRKFFLQPGINSLDELQKFLDFLLNKIYVACVFSTNPEDASDIFESENARGKQLGEIHLVRSHLFDCFKKDKNGREVLKDQIQAVVNKLRGGEDLFSAYTRCLAICRYGYLSVADFNDDFRSVIGGKANEARDFVRQLSEDYRIEVFQRIKAPREDEWFDKLSRSTGNRGRQRKTLTYIQDMQGYFSISNATLFALLCRYLEDSDTSKNRATAKFVHISSKLLSSFVQRIAHSTSGSFPTSRYGQGIANLAMKIAKETCRTPVDFLEHLKQIDRAEIASDVQYKERMLTLRFPQIGRGESAKKLRYLLSRMNEHKDSGVSGISTIEHILPRSAQYAGAWGFSKELHSVYAHRLGNLTLLSEGEDNSGDAFNRSFEKKKSLYCNSSYKITKEICDFAEWNKDSIEKRQEALADLAVIIWNLDPKKL